MAFKKLADGTFEKVIEHKRVIKKDMLIREKERLEARLAELNDDLAEIAKIE